MQRFEDLSKEEQKKVMSEYKKALAKVNTRTRATLKSPMGRTKKNYTPDFMVMPSESIA